MADLSSQPEYYFDIPATYQIVVKGSVRQDWSDRLGGMSISQVTDESGEVKTRLVGLLVDQAALTGILLSLYELHLPLIIVEQLQTPGAPQGNLPDTPQG